MLEATFERWPLVRLRYLESREASTSSRLDWSFFSTSVRIASV